ncbi:peptide-methionine (S)-S-oxide reductase MsrA [Stieleria mannarensis]|uniref:peptide-methionine (S)-S-oxide reductase MsrA n=1 Tax=Stieleria mannarensis TaxID=2755585 RepID=UPI0015FF5CA0|nr:peptide-methionine (S)-S-oxide reductase MsrA [Rhodopirellula sp. JC639]
MNVSRRNAVLCSVWIASYIIPQAVLADQPERETATFGGGCYWCVEAVFQRIEGVSNVRPGFMGGRMKNPTYQQVLTGRTGHVEVIQLEFDPDVVSYNTLLQVFWRTHDPTTKNRQGPDFGPQYRSVVFAHTEQQQEVASEYKRLLNRQQAFKSPIVTTIERATTFYPTDADHQDYFNRNRDKQYCEAYIVPKLKKLQTLFPEHVKDDAGTSDVVE